MRVYLLIMAIAAVATYLLVPVVKRLALLLGAITQVRERDVHTLPIPRLGGVAMYLGFSAAILIASRIPYLSGVFPRGSAIWGVLLGAGFMCLVGAIDDVWELVWYAKLAGEVLAAGTMAWQGVQLVTVPFMGLTVGSTRLTLFITTIVMVIVANAVNFVDGLDGLAAGIVGIAGLAFFVYSYTLTRDASPSDYASAACVVVAAVVGICAGFLPHNFHRARIFMGDSGALMLGVLIAAAGILVTGQIDPANTSPGYALPAVMPLLVPAAVIFLPLLDFTWAVARRLARGQSPFAADAGHLHHRLLRRGHSHAGAVLILYMWAAMASLTCVALVRFPARIVGTVAFVCLIFGIFVTRHQFGRRGDDADDDTRIPSADATNARSPAEDARPSDADARLSGADARPSGADVRSSRADAPLSGADVRSSYAEGAELAVPEREDGEERTKAAVPAAPQPPRGPAPPERAREAAPQRAGGKHADSREPGARPADPPEFGAPSRRTEQPPGGSLLPRSRRAARHKLIQVETEADVPRGPAGTQERAASSEDGVERVERRADARRGA